MVAGLERFAEHFKGFTNSFVLIGGAACDLWMGKFELRFRATEDLDVVLIVDAMGDDFISAFWDFIREGKYATHQQSQDRPSFYRFSDPEHGDHPKQIELLTRNELGLPEDAHLTPIPAGDDLSSLSAVLMDGTYYDYVFSSRIGGIHLTGVHTPCCARSFAVMPSEVEASPSWSTTWRSLDKLGMTQARPTAYGGYSGEMDTPITNNDRRDTNSSRPVLNPPEGQGTS